VREAQRPRQVTSSGVFACEKDIQALVAKYLFVAGLFYRRICEHVSLTLLAQAILLGHVAKLVAVLKGTL
jgi:hypothetical protein